MPDLPTTDTVEGLTAAMEGLNRVSDQVGRTLTGTFARGIASGKSFETTLRGIGQRFVDIALSAALKPAQSLVGGLLGGLLGGLGSSLRSVRPFADGGVV